MSSSTYNPAPAVHGFETPGNVTLASLFEKMAHTHGARRAVQCGSSSLSYDELNRAANGLAAGLSKTLGRGAIAAIYLERSVEMIAALVGVVKCGAAYLPIDAGYPVARVLETLEDARPAVLITSAELAAHLPEGIAERLAVVLVQDAMLDAADDALGPEIAASADDAAYIIYTSGSTGKPKGVQVSHRNVTRLISATAPWFGFNESDVWTMFHSLAFDFSVWEIWGCLLTGGRLVIVPFALSRTPEEFYQLLIDERVTVLNQTPSAFSLLQQVDAMRTDARLALRTVIFGGEPLYPRRLQPWFDRHGDVTPQLVNMYGITETTVHVSYRPMTARDAATETESLIGVAIPDMQIHVLDADGLPVREGETGEMFVGGGGVSLGYLNRPELNAERFVPDPFVQDGSRMYRTGDLARRRRDGELVYLGRGDGQVKINGFRIELGEVESALAGLEGIAQCCVVTRPDAEGNQRLAAYFVARDAASIAGVRARLAERLPAHMLPSFYLQLSQLPLTGNGKIDRASLPVPSSSGIASAAATGSATEEIVSSAWRTALASGEVGLDENFFDIGGTSLLVIAVRFELQKALDRAIPVTWMFECTTIRTLAAKLDSAAGVVSKTSEAMTAAQTQAQKQREAFARMKRTMGASR